VRILERALAGYRIHLESWSADFSKAIVFTDSKNDSGTYWVVDFATGKANELGYAYPGVNEGDVGPTRMIAYKAADGLSLEGVLTTPPGVDPKSLPLVVIPHGGPHARDDPGFDWLAQAFAVRGYAVFQPNYRGSSGYNQAFVDAAAGEVGRKMQTDVSDGVAHLAAQGLIDPKRVCIVGASFGGYTALAGVTMQKGIYRCAVSYSGVFNLSEMTSPATAARRQWIVLAGSPPQMRQVSPSERAGEADAPVLLIHGKLDTVVPVEQSREMERALRRAGKPVQIIELEGEDHNLSMSATRTAMLKAAVEFVERHNPPR
jgi:dipeptidyl aminopeptidase/acylaminoacyl peptidase